MPYFTKLARVSQSFENHYTSGNNTLLGTLGLLYGESPTFFFSQTANGQNSPFIESLNKAGFKTRVFGHGLESYRKIDSYLTNFSEPSDTKDDTDKTLVSIASFIKKNPRTFSYYYYGDTHYPYNHSPAFKKFTPEVSDDYKFIGGDIYENRDAIRNKYRNALEEADHNLELLFSMIPWRDMIIVITGDHGEAMFENGRLSHSSSLERPQTHTPMLLYYPGIAPGRLDKTTSHLDIFPTAFALDGMRIPEGAQGRNLLDDAPGMALVMHNNQNYRPVLAALITGKTKVIVNLDILTSPRVEWLYDDNDKNLRLAGVAPNVKSDFAAFRRRFEIGGCGLYDRLARTKPKTAADKILMNNLRYCR
jgi:membrane-anchored protein YejM (alkaline phosphatase superfamily)